MRTNIMKDMAETYQEDYDESRWKAYDSWKESGMTPSFYFPDIFSWLAEQIATEEEYRNDAARDDALTGD